MTRDHDHSNSYKGKCLVGLACSFRGLVHYHHSRKYGSMQVRMLLVKELRVLHLDWQAAEKENVTGHGLSI